MNKARMLVALGVWVWLASLGYSQEPPPDPEEKPFYLSRTVQEWRTRLADSEPVTRIEAVKALRAHGPSAREAFEDLLRLLMRDKSMDIKAAAFQALVRIEPYHGSVLEVCVYPRRPLLTLDRQTPRFKVSGYFFTVASQCAEILPSLPREKAHGFPLPMVRDVLRSPSPILIEATLKYLSQSGMEATQLLPELIALLSSPAFEDLQTSLAPVFVGVGWTAFEAVWVRYWEEANVYERNRLAPLLNKLLTLLVDKDLEGTRTQVSARLEVPTKWEALELEIAKGVSASQRNLIRQVLLLSSVGSPNAYEWLSGLLEEKGRVHPWYFDLFVDGNSPSAAAKERLIQAFTAGFWDQRAESPLATGRIVHQWALWNSSDFLAFLRDSVEGRRVQWGDQEAQVLVDHRALILSLIRQDQTLDLPAKLKVIASLLIRLRGQIHVGNSKKLELVSLYQEWEDIFLMALTHLEDASVVKQLVRCISALESQAVGFLSSLVPVLLDENLEPERMGQLMEMVPPLVVDQPASALEDLFGLVHALERRSLEVRGNQGLVKHYQAWLRLADAMMIYGSQTELGLPVLKKLLDRLAVSTHVIGQDEIPYFGLTRAFTTALAYMGIQGQRVVWGLLNRPFQAGHVLWLRGVAEGLLRVDGMEFDDSDSLGQWVRMLESSGPGHDEILLRASAAELIARYKGLSSSHIQLLGRLAVRQQEPISVRTGALNGLRHLKMAALPALEILKGLLSQDSFPTLNLRVLDVFAELGNPGFQALGQALDQWVQVDAHKIWFGGMVNTLDLIERAIEHLVTLIHQNPPEYLPVLENHRKSLHRSKEILEDHNGVTVNLNALLGLLKKSK
jgi:hypothetical protein